jgi:hypothetical protein
VYTGKIMIGETTKKEYKSAKKNGTPHYKEHIDFLVTAYENHGFYFYRSDGGKHYVVSNNIEEIWAFAFDIDKDLILTMSHRKQILEAL